MAFRYSSFPQSIDKLKRLPEYQELSAEDKSYVARYTELCQKGVNMNTQEKLEFSDLLTNKLRDKMIQSVDWNLLADAVTNLEDFYLNHVLKDISDMINKAEKQIKDYGDITITAMDNKRKYFIRYVDTKEDEVRTLIQEFDTRTTRYYQVWKATKSQKEYNIFDKNAKNQELPKESKLDITEENIDLIVNGASMTPYEDFYIKKTDKYDTIVLTENNSSLIEEGTEIIAKWFKNVGKLYFHHAYTHEEGGYDQINVTYGLLDKELQNKIPIVSRKPPESPTLNQIWIDTTD